MRSAVLGRFTNTCFRALLVLLAWAFVDQGRVFADCRSHDVPAISLSTGSVAGFESLDLAGPNARIDLTEVPGRSKPCTGPACSGRPAMPLSPATPDAQRIASWAILEAPAPRPAPETSEPRLDDSTVRPTHSTSLIFHPPRLLPILITS